MKLLLERGMRPHLAGVAAGLLFVAGCSSGQSVPSAGPGSALAPSSHVTITGTAPEGFVPDACTDPKILKICVRPGGSTKIALKLTCHRNSSPIKCGKVHWATKMSHAGLAGSFKPDPGNPTTETVTAAKSVKKGHYTQTIKYKCSAFPSCAGSSKGQVWVV